jgi:signal transduction histidine kinase/FixJ family two-component response regulator
MRRSLSNVFRTVVVLWLALSIASVIVAGITWFELSKRLNTSADAVALREAVDGIVLLLLEIETGERGFAITGQESHLEPFKRAETELPLQFERLVGIARNDPALTKEVMDLRAKAESVLVHYRKVVGLRRDQGFSAAAEIIEQGTGTKAMQEIRRQAALLSRVWHDQTLPEGLSSRTHLRRAGLTSMVAGALGIGAAVLAFLLERQRRQLTVANVNAERISQAKSELLANMSHEIRTPMNSILGFSELLEADVRDPKQRRYVQSLRSSAGSLLQLINDVLDLSKIDAGAMVLSPEPTDPREVGDFIRTVFAESAAKKGVKLWCHVAEDMPRSVLVDRLRLRQLLLNLVGNALKFTDHGSVEVRLWCEKPERSNRISLFLEVVDTGIGIPEERLADVFQPFVQAGPYRPTEQGSGLGLAIVKRLTEAMGGTIQVTSKASQGTAFHLTFKEVPISARLAVEESEKVEVPVDFDELRPARILVVDDNELNRQFLAAMFEGTHHHLTFGCNGREAVEKAREVRPDIALLDVRMPEMSGPEALDAIRRTPGLELMPVIAVTASSLLEQEAALQEKFNGYLRKPVTQRQLFHELAQFLPRQRSPRTAPQEARDAAASAEWRELAGRLRQLVEEDWPPVRDSLSISETLAFARTLEALGEQANCEPVLRYAQTLSSHAEAYAAGPMETQLLGFPALVDQVERSACSTV